MDSRRMTQTIGLSLFAALCGLAWWIHVSANRVVGAVDDANERSRDYVPQVVRQTTPAGIELETPRLEGESNSDWMTRHLKSLRRIQGGD